MNTADAKKALTILARTKDTDTRTAAIEALANLGVFPVSKAKSARK